MESEDLSAYIETDQDGDLTVFYSHPTADHDPDYRKLATTNIKSLAQILRSIAFDLAKPI